MRIGTLHAREVAIRPANDNVSAADEPVVRTPRGRSDATYARSDNVILPLRFAERMAGWTAMRFDGDDAPG